MEKNKKLHLKVPGQHNISNAMAVLAVARQLNISDKISIKVLNDFSGTWRRMEFRGKINKAKIFDDYGHHPTEIKVTLQGAMELLPGRSAAGVKSKAIKKNPSTGSGDMRGRLWCVFQPHQYQRTYKLFNQFLTAFDTADKTIILPIYSVAGREKESIKKKVDSQKLVKAIREKNREIIYSDSFGKAKNYLRKNLKKGDVCVIMGAGDINKLTDIMVAGK